MLLRTMSHELKTPLNAPFWSFSDLMSTLADNLGPPIRCVNMPV